MKTLTIFSLLFLASCSNSETTKTTEKKDSLPKNELAQVSQVAGCYKKATGRDTMFLQIEQSGTEIRGSLTFDNYEKDSSTGTVKGTIQGDLLMLWYNFQSEGMSSVSQVYFKKEGSILIFGTGPVETKGDTAYFPQPGSVKYDPSEALTTVNCIEGAPR
jgi:hypothetical protein